MSTSSPRTNNYDLIRLVSALQVLYIHGVTHLRLKHPSALVNTVKLFPGVPIFFFLSGVLISMSWERSPDVRSYARNRLLRIYPALIVCTILAAASIFVAGYLWRGDASVTKFAAMLVGQVTVAQFFTPAFLRGYGSGAFNGSLSTVTVELQFYVLLPFIYWLLAFRKRPRAWANGILVLGIAVFLVANTVFLHLGGQQDGRTFMKIFDVSFLPWFYMFLLGVLAQRNMDRVLAVLRGRAVFFVALYVGIALFTRAHLDWKVSNAIHPVLFILLAAAALSCAHTKPELSERILHHNDVSYGIYIFHMPVFNFMIFKGWTEQTRYVFLAAAVTVALAVLSWRLVERPALRRKKATVRAGQQPVAATVAG
jgi:peptidoglycan/LPS O-acetylase OafA/YrhL